MTDPHNTPDDETNTEPAEMDKHALDANVQWKAVWKNIETLAQAYYADKTNLLKRQALYDALLQEHHEKVFDPETQSWESKPRGNALKQLARLIVKVQKKGDLGAGVTDLSDELLQNFLTRQDTHTDLPWWRATVLFGNAEHDVQGRYDPNKAALQTWFSFMLRNCFVDACRSYHREQKQHHFVDADTPAQDSDTGQAPDPWDRLSLQDLERYANSYDSFELQQKFKQVQTTLQNETERVRDVGAGVAMSPWTDETDKEIQERLGLSRDEYRYAKEKALRCLRPLLQTWVQG